MLHPSFFSAEDTVSGNSTLNVSKQHEFLFSMVFVCFRAPSSRLFFL